MNVLPMWRPLRSGYTTCKEIKNNLKFIAYTNFQILDSLMITKSMTQRQSNWAEILKCLEFEIEHPRNTINQGQCTFVPTTIDTIQGGQTELQIKFQTSKCCKEDLSNGSAIVCMFEEVIGHPEDPKKWFKVNIFRITDCYNTTCFEMC